ncbi:YbjN domain-containing protein [Cellulomonas citrea]|uniref:YbjN domain-containing protein n=1 Tax=Cellulomonas citrea TaxID=1909423 RepID=UPI00135A5350|nr:YbjN domain-containing protein [Cellulomonas citrea]
MAFFPKTVTTPAGPAPLTAQRVAAVLDAREYTYGWSADQTRLGGFWDDHLVEFVFYGEQDEILQVRAHWGRPLGVEHRAQVLDVLNETASGRLWPKAYVDIEDDELAVYAEHAVDYEHGVTDAQLDTHLACAVTASLGLFARLDEAFPEAVEAWRAQQEAEHGDHDGHDHDAHPHEESPGL